MKSLKICLALALLALASCASTAEYVAADEATYNAIAPAYEKYIRDDPSLSMEEKDRRIRTVATWKMRIEKNK